MFRSAAALLHTAGGYVMPTNTLPEGLGATHLQPANPQDMRARSSYEAGSTPGPLQL
jgi:hypothetical protein